MHFTEHKKIVFIRDSEVGPARPFLIAQVKPYLASETTAHSFMKELQEKVSTVKNPGGVFVTEVLDSANPRCDSEEMGDAKKIEIENLLEGGTFKVILPEEVPPDGNILPDRFVLAI